MKWLVIGVGGALGALARAAVYQWLADRSATFPWATVLVNVPGAFALGVVVEIGVRRPGWELVVFGFGVGFLGAFTTFSTFGLETVRLLQRNELGVAALSVLLNVVGAVTAAALGVLMARRLLWT